MTPSKTATAGIIGGRRLYSQGKIVDGVGGYQTLAIAQEALSVAERGAISNQNPESGGLVCVYTRPILARLAAAFVRQRRFTADASHELRPPITAIRSQAELALSRPRTAEAYQATLVRIEDAAERMQRLVSWMLTLARRKRPAAPRICRHGCGCAVAHPGLHPGRASGRAAGGADLVHAANAHGDHRCRQSNPDPAQPARKRHRLH